MRCPRCFTEVSGDEEKCRKCGYLITGYSRDYFNPYEFRDKEWDPYIGILHPVEVAEDVPVDKPGDNPADKPGDNPADKPQDKPGDSPGDKPEVTKKKHHFFRNLIILLLVMLALYVALYDRLNKIPFIEKLNLPRLPAVLSDDDLSSSGGNNGEGDIAEEPKLSEDTGVPEKPAESDEMTVRPEIILTDNVQAVSIASRIDGTEIQATASSHYEPKTTGKNFTELNAFDGDETTNWQEGSSGAGNGEWIKATFSKPEKIKYITFRMGSWESGDKYLENCRPWHVKIFLDENEYDLELVDEMKEAAYEVVPSAEIDSFILEIVDVYPGSKYVNDMAISDISFYRE